MAIRCEGFVASLQHYSAQLRISDCHSPAYAELQGPAAAPALPDVRLTQFSAASGWLAIQLRSANCGSKLACSTFVTISPRFPHLFELNIL
jgi:hypothetical protein